MDSMGGLPREFGPLVRCSMFVTSPKIPGFRIRIRMDPYLFDMLDPDPDPGGPK
jgi:hypothetical protein